MKAACLIDCRNTLGEACVWDPRDSRLYWTDIEESRVFRLEPGGEVTTFEMPERTAFLLPRSVDGFVVGFASRIAVSDANLATFATVATIEPQLPQTRVNDAKVDPFGGIVFGTFDERDRQPVASLYRLAPNGGLRTLLRNVTISNGIAFSPDGSLMYFADTAEGTIRRFAVGPGFASFVEEAPLAQPDIAPGRPDGAVVDAEGYYWSARVWGHAVARIAPHGALSSLIELPVRGPTCPALGGSGRSTLFVTSLRTRHTPEELEEWPTSGGLFAAEVASAGCSQTLSLL